MKTLHLSIMAVVLIVIGISSGLLILYDYLNNPHLISKERAFTIAIKAGNWSKNSLIAKTLDAKLLHIKNDGFAFMVDENTLEDKSLYNEKFHIAENQYVWMVSIIADDQNHPAHNSWGYLINASSGRVLEPGLE